MEPLDSDTQKALRYDPKSCNGPFADYLTSIKISEATRYVSIYPSNLPNYGLLRSVTFYGSFQSPTEFDFCLFTSEFPGIKSSLDFNVSPLCSLFSDNYNHPLIFSGYDSFSLSYPSLRIPLNSFGYFMYLEVLSHDGVPGFITCHVFLEVLPDDLKLRPFPTPAII